MPRIAQEFVDIPFTQLRPGATHRTEYTVTPELVATYDRLLDIPPGARNIVPPWLYCTFLPVYRALGGRMAQGSIHVRQRVEQLGQARVGDVLDVTVTVAEAAMRKGRPNVVLEVEYGRDGAALARVMSTLLWGGVAR